MEALQRLQPLDFVLVLVWAGVVGWGVRTGLIRQAVMLVAAYVAAIAASQLYKPVGSMLANFGFGPGAVPQMQLMAYVLLFALVLGGLAALAWRMYPHTRLMGRRRLDTVLGGVIGALWGVLLLIQLVTMARFFTATTWPAQDFTKLQVASQIQRSQILPVLQVGFSPAWGAMAPWFPDPLRGGAPTPGLR